ncbi:MAG: hypothetical protein WDO15_27625 [Bacteroidota bacterium]
MKLLMKMETRVKIFMRLLIGSGRHSTTSSTTSKPLIFQRMGASFVHLGDDGLPCAPLYNYLKAFPEDLKAQFYETYGGENDFAKTTASPVLGSLNSGMILYLLKYRKPEIFRKIRQSLHLPQYVSSLFTSAYCSDLTSIGCHTNLWDFQANSYHRWVLEEGIESKLAPVRHAGPQPLKLRLFTKYCTQV